MNTIYKISFKIYRIILITIIPLFLIAKILVGAAGHNTETKNEDYLLFTFVVITLTLLSVLKAMKTKIQLRNTIRFTLIVLILISIVFLCYGLNEYFQYGDNIPMTIITLLILLSITIIIGILKDKIQ